MSDDSIETTHLPSFTRVSQLEFSRERIQIQFRPNQLRICEIESTMTESPNSFTNATSPVLSRVQ